MNDRNGKMMKGVNEGMSERLKDICYLTNK